MKIGILVTNTDDSEFARSQLSDGEKFSRLMQFVRPDWDYIVYDCVAGSFPETGDDCEGYIIGGSPASVNDADPWVVRLLMVLSTKLHHATYHSLK